MKRELWLSALVLASTTGCLQPTEPSVTEVVAKGRITMAGQPFELARVYLAGIPTGPCGFGLCLFLSPPSYSDARGEYLVRLDVGSPSDCDALVVHIELLLPDATLRFEEPLPGCSTHVVNHDFAR